MAGSKEYYRLFHKRVQDMLNHLKDVPCMDCGNKFPPECMDFDHVRGIKKFQIAMHRSIATMLTEIEKCDIVCANCHRTRTKMRRDDKAA